MSKHAWICIQPHTVGGSMHLVGLQSINTHKEDEKASAHFFFQANVMHIAVALEEHVLNVSIKIN